MIHWANYHSHCNYCDGSENPEEYIQQAIAQELVAYGFSSHAPLPFECNWCMHTINQLNYLNEIALLGKKYKKDIQVYIGMEVDFIPGVMSINHPSIKNMDLDYTIGSIHFIPVNDQSNFFEIDGNHDQFLKDLSTFFKNDIMEVMKIYFHLVRQMVTEACPDVIGHLDKIKIQNQGDKFYHDQNRWYQKEVVDTLNLIKDSGAIVEVNTRGIYKELTNQPYPSTWVLEKIYQMGIPITISSDAHQPNEITYEFENTAAMLKGIGFKKIMCFLDNSWQAVSFDRFGIKLNQHA